MRAEHFDTRLEIKGIGEDGTFSGYGSVFNVADTYRDVMQAGCFSSSLADWQKRSAYPSLLWQHDTAQPIGVYTAMREDARGLYVEGTLLKNDVRQAAEAYALMKAGALSGLSVGFYTKADEWDAKASVRKLLEVDLCEVSLVTFPANPAARVQSVKSVDAVADLKSAEDYLRESGLSKAQSVAIVSRIKAIAIRRDSEAREADRTADAVRRLLATLTA